MGVNHFKINSVGDLNFQICSGFKVLMREGHMYNNLPLASGKLPQFITVYLGCPMPILPMPLGPFLLQEHPISRGPLHNTEYKKCKVIWWARQSNAKQSREHLVGNHLLQFVSLPWLVQSPWALSAKMPLGPFCKRGPITSEAISKAQDPHKKRPGPPLLFHHHCEHCVNLCSRSTLVR